MNETTPDPIEAACIAWLNNYNDTARDGRDMRSDGPRANCGHEFIRRCKAAGLNPGLEDVTAYPSGGGLVFIPALQTMLRRAKETGHLTGIVQGSRVREDKKIVAWAEVHRWIVPPTGLQKAGVHITERTFKVEGTVDGWNKQCGGRSPFWQNNPEHMTGNAILRCALLRAFPDVLQEFRESAEDADWDGPILPRPAAPASLAAVGSGSATTEQAADVARARLAEARQKPAVIVAPVAVAPVVAPPVATESPAIQAGAAVGLSAGDLDALAHRWKGKPLDELTEADVDMLIKRFLPNRPATMIQTEEVQTLHSAYMATEGRTEDDWLAIIATAGEQLGARVAWFDDCKYLTQPQAELLIEMVESAVRGQ